MVYKFCTGQIFFVKKSGSTNNTLDGPYGIDLTRMDCTINL